MLDRRRLELGANVRTTAIKSFHASGSTWLDRRESDHARVRRHCARRLAIRRQVEPTDAHHLQKGEPIVLSGWPPRQRQPFAIEVQLNNRESGSVPACHDWTGTVVEDLESLLIRLSPRRSQGPW